MLKDTILHINRTLDQSGPGRIIYSLSQSNAFSDSHFVLIFSLPGSKATIRKYKAYGIDPYPCFYPKLWISRFSYTLDQWVSKLIFSINFVFLILRIKPAIVHLQAADKWASPILEIMRRLKVPLVLTIHQMGPVNQEFMKSLTRFVYKSNNYMVTAVSKSVYQSSGLDEIVPPQKKRIIYNGVDVTEYSTRYVRSPHWRFSNDIPLEAFVFSTMGRIINIKRFDLFIDASKLLTEKGIQAHFVLAGQGDEDLERSYRAKIREYRLDEVFHFLPWQEDVRDLLSTTDVYVQCSDSEGFPVALLEACAMGVPCIATEVGGIPEVFHKSVMLIPPGSAENLAKAMQRMLVPRLRQSYSVKGSQLSKQFSSEKMATDYKQVYRSLLESLHRGC